MRSLLSNSLVVPLTALLAGPAMAAAVASGTLNLQIELSGASGLDWNKDVGTTLETWSLAHIHHSSPWETKASATREVYDWDRAPGWTPVPQSFSIGFGGSTASNANSATDPFKPQATTSVTAFHDGTTSAGYVTASGQYVFQAGLHVPDGSAPGSFTFTAKVGGSGSVQTDAVGDWGQVSQSLSAYIMRGAWVYNPVISWGYIQYEDAYVAEDGLAVGWPGYFLQADGTDDSYSADELGKVSFTVPYNPGDYFYIRTDSSVWARVFALAAEPPPVPEPQTLVLAFAGLVAAWRTGRARRA